MTFFGLFSVVKLNCFTNEKRLCGCLWGQVVSSALLSRNWVAQRSTPGCEGLFLVKIQRGGRPVCLQQMAAVIEVEKVSGG
jgi:hypothetical protein